MGTPSLPATLGATEEWGASREWTDTAAPSATKDWAETKDWAAEPAPKEWGEESLQPSSDWGTSVTMQDSTSGGAEWAQVEAG